MAGVRFSGASHEMVAECSSGANRIPEMPTRAWVTSSAAAQRARCEARQEMDTECERSLHQGVERYQSTVTFGTATFFADESFMDAIRFRSDDADQSNRYSLGEAGAWGSS